MDPTEAYEMVTYPRQPHSVREPRLIKDLGERNLAWMEKYVKGASSPQTSPAGRGGSSAPPNP